MGYPGQSPRGQPLGGSKSTKSTKSHSKSNSISPPPRPLQGHLIP